MQAKSCVFAEQKRKSSKIFATLLNCRKKSLSLRHISRCFFLNGSPRLGQRISSARFALQANLRTSSSGVFVLIEGLRKSTALLRCFFHMSLLSYFLIFFIIHNPRICFFFAANSSCEIIPISSNSFSFFISSTENVCCFCVTCITCGLLISILLLSI